MKKIIVPGLIAVFLLTACAVPQKTKQRGDMPEAVAGSVGGKSTVAENGKMMDNLERDMRNALTASESSSVHRKGDILTITLKGDVAFDTGSADIKPELHSEIARVAAVLASYAKVFIRVEGHSDSTSSEEYNMNLSLARAKAVRKLLFESGVGPRWIDVTGFGETKPIATNETEEGRRENRRVEIKVIPY